MFRTSISFPFSRIFRLRRRRTARANTSCETPAVVSCSGPSPSSKSRRPVSVQLEPINTNPPSTRRPRSLFVSSLLSPIAQSPHAASPSVTPVPGTPPPILIIGQDPLQSTLPPPPAPAPPGHVGPQAPVDGVSLIESPPISNSRRCSFQLPIIHPEDRPATPLSTCSTLVTEVGQAAEAEMAAQAVPLERSAALDAFDSASVESVSPEPVAELPSRGRSGSGRARPISLFIPQPVRAHVRRFSLPATPITASAEGGRRENKRNSFKSFVSNSGRRMSRWSKELDKPETQDILWAVALNAFC